MLLSDDSPANTKHLYNILYNVGPMLYKCFFFVYSDPINVINCAILRYFKQALCIG